MGSCDNSSSQKHKEIQKNKEISEINNSSKNNKIINEQGMLQEDLNKNTLMDNYYLICPDCEIRSLHIDKLYYKEDLKDIMVKYSCICFENPRNSKEIQLIKIFGKNKPKNMFNIHPENKLRNYCIACN